jgi:hypothetical protein
MTSRYRGGEGEVDGARRGPEGPYVTEGRPPSTTNTSAELRPYRS